MEDHEKRLSCLKNPNRLITVEPVIFLFISGFLLQVPVLQQYLYDRAAEDVGVSRIGNVTVICNAHNQTTIDSNAHKEVQKTASQYILVVSLAVLLPSIFMSSLYGSWSDKRGRRRVLLLPSLGIMLEVLSIILVMYLNLPLYVICIGAGIAGVFGQYPTMVLGILAYIIDTTPDQKKVSFRLGVIESCAFMSGVVGQFLSGVWIEKLGYESPFLVMLAIHFLNSLYIAALLPESLPKTSRQDARLFSCSNYSNLLSVLTKPRKGGRWHLYTLLLTYFFMMLTANIVVVIFVLFAKGYPLCLGKKEIGYFLGSYLFSKAIGGVTGLKIFTSVFKLSNYSMALIGFTFTMAHLLMLGTATSLDHVFYVDIVATLSAMGPPCIRAEISKAVDRNEQGTVFALTSCMESICTFVSNIFFTPLYALSLDFDFGYSHGTVFFVAAGITFIPFFITSIQGFYEGRSQVYGKLDEESGEEEDNIIVPVSGQEDVIASIEK